MSVKTSNNTPAEDEAAIVGLKGRAVFSTNYGQHNARTHWKDQPVQIRSNYESDRAAFIAQLRNKFPIPCIKLKQEDLTPATILEYFDDFDVHFYSPTFLFEALGYMARANEIDRAARSEEVDGFVNGWIDANREAFGLLDPSLQWDDMFHQNDTETRSFPFLWDAFTRISQINENHRNAKRLEMHVGKMHQHDGVTQTSPNQRRSSATRPPSVPDPSPVSYVSFPSPIYHAQQATIPAYLPHSFPSPVYFQASRRQSTTSRVTETSTTPITIANSGPPIYQAPMRPLMPQSFIPTSRNIDRTEAQGGSLGRNNKMTRKDFHSDPLAQAWTPKPGYSKNFHVLYSAGNPGPFQYHRLPMSNRQRGYLTKSSNLHRGIRNPPKQISDDARTLSDTVSHDSPDWVAATSLPLNHGLAPEPHFKRPSRTSSLGSGGQLVDYRNRDPSNFRDVVQPQLSASARTPIRVDNEQVSKPRFVSNPFTMYKILEEDHSSVHARDQLALEQQGTFERSEIHPTLQEQQAPTRKTLQPIFYQFQEDPSRDPLAPTPNAGYNRPNPAQQRNDMSNCKLWVANFSSEATRNDLIEVLMYLPGFIDVEEPRSPGNYRHCWTFVRFRTPEDAESALLKFQSVQPVKGQQLSARRARPFRHDGRPMRSSARRPTNESLETSKDLTVAVQPNTPHLVHQSTPTSGVCQPRIKASSPQTPPQIPKTPGHTRPALAPIEPQEINILHPSIVSELNLHKAVEASVEEVAKSQASEKVGSSIEELGAVLETASQSGRSGNGNINDEEKETGHETSRSPQLYGSQTQPAINREHDQGNTSQDFPPLSKLAKSQEDPLPSSNEQIVPNASFKSFAQVASQGVVRPDVGAFDVGRPPSIQELSSKGHTTPQIPSNLGQGKQSATIFDTRPPTQLRSISITTSSNESRRSKSKVSEKQHVSKEVEVSAKENKDLEFRDTISPADSQKTTRNSSIFSADITSSTSPAPGLSTAITTDHYASPRGSFRRNDEPAKSIETAIPSDTGIDADRLRSRLESAATAENSALSDADDERMSVSQDIIKPLNQNTPLDKSTSPTSPMTVPLICSRAESPVQAERPIKRRPATPPPPEPISTHKKKSRSKPATPTKRTFQSSGKHSQDRNQPVLSSPSTSPLTGRTQYPSIQNDLVTVLELPHATKTPPIETKMVVNDNAQPLKTAPKSPLTPAMSLTCQQMRYEKQVSTPLTLAQRVARLPRSSVIESDLSIPLQPGAVQVQRTQNHANDRIESDLIWVDANDEPAKQQLHLAFLCAYKLKRLAAIIETESEIAQKAAEWHSEFHPLISDNSSDRLLKLMAWNAQVVPWVDSLPQSLIFNNDFSQDVAIHGKGVERKLEEIRGHLRNARAAPSDPLGATSAQLDDKVTSLLDNSPRNGRLALIGRAEIEELMVWIYRASDFISKLEKVKLSTPQNGEVKRDSSTSRASVFSTLEPFEPGKIPSNEVTTMELRPTSDHARRGQLLTQPVQNERHNGSLEADELKTQIAICASQEKLKDERTRTAKEAENSRPSQLEPKSKSKAKSKKKAKAKKHGESVLRDPQHINPSLKADDEDQKPEGKETLPLEIINLEDSPNTEAITGEDRPADGKSALQKNASIVDQEKPTYLSRSQLHSGLTENEYIYITANQRFLAEEPLFDATGNVWDHIPQSTPWGPTNMEPAMRMLKERVHGSEKDMEDKEPDTVPRICEEDLKELDGKFAGDLTAIVAEAAPNEENLHIPGQTVDLITTSESKTDKIEAEAGDEDETSIQKSGEKAVVGTQATSSKPENPIVTSPAPASVPSLSPRPVTEVKKIGKDAWRVPSNEPVWGSNLRGGKGGGGGQGRAGGGKSGRKGRTL